MLGRIVLACVVGAVAFLACLLVGSILVAVSLPVLATVGAFLREWAVVIGVLAGLAWFFSGRTIP